MVRLYGLKVCDTCRKAAKELEQAGNTVEFIDVRADPLSASQLRLFAETFGEALVNRRSTTWRGLSDSDRQADTEELILAHPTLMKRPVIVNNDVMTLGWDAASKERHLG